MTRSALPLWLKKFFQNKNGELVIWQFPNFPLIAGAGFALLARMFTQSRLHAGLMALGTAWFLTWSYLEVRYGESMFRRVLGALVLLGSVASYFMHAEQ